MKKILLSTACVVFCLTAASAASDQHCSADGPCNLDHYLSAIPQSIRESHIFFPEGGVFLDSTAKAQLSLLATALATPTLRFTCLRLEGHADPEGPADVNMQISVLRAQAVFDFLQSELGQAAPTIELAGFGETQPMPNLPKDSILHRRVAVKAKQCLPN